MAAGLSLPTRAQLLELRRAGVTEYRRIIGDETVLLTLRPLFRGRRPDEEMGHARSWFPMNEKMKEWASLSRSQRRRRNKRMDKQHNCSICTIQCAARGWLARKSFRQARSTVTTVQSCDMSACGSQSRCCVK